ncbi:hypothetical protein DMENIID0001_166740 [Sergentomyia squamirostris]
MEEEAVNSTVINEEIRTRKHTMHLCLGTESDDKNAISVDQTPTPTRLIRNCEEVGLFEDLKHVNPFEETFRRAVEDGKTPSESGLMLPDGPDFESAAKIVSEDTLHTPHIFPSSYYTPEATADTPKSPQKKEKTAGQKRKWMPTKWKLAPKIEKTICIRPKAPVSTEILQPTILIPPTIIVKCLPTTCQNTALRLPIPSTTTTSSTVKEKLKNFCKEAKFRHTDVKIKTEVDEGKHTIIPVQKEEKNNKSNGSNKEAVKRYRERLKNYRDYLKSNNQQLQEENSKLKQQNEALRDLLRKHKIRIPKELIEIN